MNKQENLIKPKKSSRSLWTLSWRIKGLSFGLLAAAVFCYFYLQNWDKWILLLGLAAGYFLGWLVGLFTYQEN